MMKMKVQTLVLQLLKTYNVFEEEYLFESLNLNSLFTCSDYFSLNFRTEAVHECMT